MSLNEKMRIFFLVLGFSLAANNELRGETIYEKDIKKRYLKLCKGEKKFSKECLKNYKKDKKNELDTCIAVTPSKGRKYFSENRKSEGPSVECKKKEGGLRRLDEVVSKLEKKIRARGRWISGEERDIAKIKMRKDLEKERSLDVKALIAKKKNEEDKERLDRNVKKAFEKWKNLKNSKKKNKKELKIAEDNLEKVSKEKRDFEKTEEEGDRHSKEVFGVSKSKKPCDLKNSHFIPLSLLKKMTYLGKGIDVEIKKDKKTGKRTLSVEFPDYIYKCFSPEIIVKKAKGNKIFIAVKNKSPNVHELEGENFPRKFEECLSRESINIDNPKGDVYNRPPKKKNYGSHIDLSKMDPSEDIRVLFGSPDDWPHKKYSLKNKVKKGDEAIFLGTPNSPNHCLNGLVSEELEKGRSSLYGWKQKAKELKALCKSSETSKDDLEDALKELTNYPEKLVVDVKKILESQLEKKLEEDIENDIKYLKERAESIIEEDEDGDISEELDEYLSKLRSLDNYYLRPKLRKLDKLLAERKNSKNKSEIDKKIKKLNEQIGRFYKDRKKLKTNGLLKKLLFLGHNDEANEIHLYHIHSKEFSRVYIKKDKKDKRDKRDNKKISSKKASRTVEKEQVKFERLSFRSAMHSKAMKGEASFSHINRRNIKNLSRRRSERMKSFYNKEKKYASYCKRSFFGMVKNANKCKRYRKGQKSRYRRMKSIIGSMDKKVARERRTEKRFRALENKARSKKREEMDIDFRRAESDSYSESLLGDDFMEGIYKKRLKFFGDLDDDDNSLLDSYSDTSSSTFDFNNPLEALPNSTWGMSPGGATPGNQMFFNSPYGLSPMGSLY